MITVYLIYIINHLYPGMQAQRANSALSQKPPPARSDQTSRPTDILTWSRIPLTNPPEASLP